MCLSLKKTSLNWRLSTAEDLPGNNNNEEDVEGGGGWYYIQYLVSPNINALLLVDVFVSITKRIKMRLPGLEG